uniref:Uncharacterized protein n=1 Tax=Aplanochytrium stocchinoi TaxID=215587 RepID=A0A7S3PLK1_9STRA|mmetsp:Transcript_6076/g.7661  ORF Transcript_6076/g.7661 Transcript_6076/m.7661 type:complete len:328 (+) Transcript_6076:162-1145(+)
MAHLITKHDPFHIHKILGVFVLLSFLYRLFNVGRYGIAFPKTENKWFSVCSVALHGVLSLSSLLLPLPKKRNFSSPMIWPEFRLHSIVFAMRHVICTIINLLQLWPTNFWANLVAKASIVLSTISLARLITENYGDKVKRTTNSMPYPRNVTKAEEKLVKNLYAQAQFHAVIQAIFEDPTASFMPILAIQAAPLLMTLVRKGKIGSYWYHRIYAISLWLPFAIYWWRFYLRTIDMGEIYWSANVARLVVLKLRFSGYNQEFAWAVGFFFLALGFEYLCPPFNHMVNNNIYYYCFFLTGYTILGPTYDKRHYLPLFRSKNVDIRSHVD